MNEGGSRSEERRRRGDEMSTNDQNVPGTVILGSLVKVNDELTKVMTTSDIEKVVEQRDEYERKYRELKKWLEGKKESSKRGVGV